MRHDQVREQLSSYIEGALEPAMAAALESHVRACDACAEELAAMRQVYRLLSSPEMEVEPPPPFHDNVMRKVRLSQREQARSPRGIIARLGWGWTAVSAAAAAAVLLAFILAVGPLQEGISAGFGLGRHLRPSAPQGTYSMPAGRIYVTFSESQPGPGQDRPVSVRLLAPEDGEWRLLAQLSPGLALLTTGASQNEGALEPWRGRLSTGQSADVTLRLFTTAPGAVTELTLRLENDKGRLAAEQTIFVPGATGSGSGNPVVAWERGTLGAALTDFVRTSGQPVAAPTEALGAPVPVASADTEERVTLPNIAARAGLRVQTAGGGYTLAP